MAKDKKSVILYCDIIHTIEKLTDEQAGKFFKHYLRYVNDLDPKTDDFLVEIIFEPIKQSLKRDLKKYEDYKKKQSENGQKGGRPKKAKESQKTQPFFEKPKKADSDSVSVSVSDSNNKTHSNKFEEELFEKFWNVYGKKRGRKTCIDIWKKKKVDLELANKIIKAANEYASITEVKFRKDPERWLRDERWEDFFGDSDLPIFSERTMEQHAKEYASYPENAMQTFRRKYKDELPPEELHKLAMKLEDIVYP